MEQPSTAPAKDPIVKTATEARQGTTPGIVRWVLLFSTVGAVIALAVTYVAVHGM